LPDTVGNLKNLEQVSLVDNQLQTLPQSIKDLKKIERLDLRGNPDLLKDAETREIARTLMARGTQVFAGHFDPSDLDPQPIHDFSEFV
jgi:hypothetical protein